MWDFISKITIAVASSVILSALGLLYANAVRLKKKRKSIINGDWFGYIFDSEGNVVKTDTFSLKVKGEDVAGVIKRTFPAEQAERHWEFTGKIKNKCFFAIYWPEDDLNMSSGCWFLRQIDDKAFDGYYYRNPHEFEERTPILSVPMIITRRQHDTRQTRGEILGNTPRPTSSLGAPRRAVGGAEETVVPIGRWRQ